MADTDNVVEWGGITKLDLDPKRIIDQARATGYDSEKDFYFASSKADGGGVLWLLELAKRRLMDIACEQDEGDSCG